MRGKIPSTVVDLDGGFAAAFFSHKVYVAHQSGSIFWGHWMELRRVRGGPFEGQYLAAKAVADVVLHTLYDDEVEDQTHSYYLVNGPVGVGDIEQLYVDQETNPLWPDELEFLGTMSGAILRWETSGAKRVECTFFPKGRKRALLQEWQKICERIERDKLKPWFLQA
jgi:hypothetical protein